MRKKPIRVWYEDIQFEGRRTRLHYTVPDMFFDYALYICLGCAARLGVDRDYEHYHKRDFESEKAALRCPECASSLDRATRYPDTFLWDDLEVGYFETSRARPSEDKTEVIEIWDVFSE